MKTINLNGDAAITVGDDPNTQILIYASSAVLAQASPQFAALWQTSEIVTDLYFPNDSPVAFACLIMILHRCHDGSTLLEPAQMIDFATIALNYGCVDKVKGTPGLFPPETMMRYIARDAEAVRNLAVSAYLLDCPELFEKYTRLLLLTTESTLALATSTIGKMVPVAVWCTWLQR